MGSCGCIQNENTELVISLSTPKNYSESICFKSPPIEVDRLGFMSPILKNFELDLNEMTQQGY